MKICNPEQVGCWSLGGCKGGILFFRMVLMILGAEEGAGVAVLVVVCCCEELLCTVSDTRKSVVGTLRLYVGFLSC